MYVKGILKDRIYLQGNFQVEKQCGSVTIHISNTLFTQVNDILLIEKKSQQKFYESHMHALVHAVISVILI